MKRIIALLAVLLFCLCACSNAMLGDDEKEVLEFEDGAVYDVNDDEFLLGKAQTFVGVWLSYLEISPEKQGGSREDYEKQMSVTFDNIKKVGATDVFIQVRPFADAIYPSAIFPSSDCVAAKRGAELGFDYFSSLLSLAKQRELKVHAWINPYRVQRSLDEEALCENEPAEKWLNDSSNSAVKASGGLYFNPASEQVRKLIVDGVREILSGYDIDGIHIDDYFYPTDEKTFDAAQYAEYQKSGGTLSLESWRRENVNLLLKQLYSAVKSFGQDKMLTVSPAGDIEKDRQTYFADVTLWLSQEGYCDMLIPQLYYGYENETLPFEKTALEWKNAATGKTKLCAGLALYKAGREDIYAGESGKDEWQTNDDIISRQARFVLENGYDGICLYSADFIKFNENETQNLYNMLYSMNNK